MKKEDICDNQMKFMKKAFYDNFSNNSGIGILDKKKNFINQYYTDLNNWIKNDKIKLEDVYKFSEILKDLFIDSEEGFIDKWLAEEIVFDFLLLQ